MKKILLCVAVITLLSIATLAGSEEIQQPQGEILATSTVQKPTLSHQQQVWLGALEWCESRGKHDAINPEDRDGTPSYGSFQFKPSTLDYYAKKYGIATTTVMDYKVQRAVIEAMVLDGKNINWSQQFPDCVKKNGKPPLK